MKLDIEHCSLEKSRNTLLFLPAFPTTKDMYVNQIKLLREKKIPFIAVNYPGIGKSEKPQKIEMNVKELVEIIWSNISSLGFSKLIPVGTSMGGYVMFELWRQHRDRISGFVFCHTRPEALDEEGRKRRLSDLEKINENLDEYLKSFTKNLVSDYTLQNRLEVVKFLEEIVKNTTKEGLSALVYVIATRPDSRSLLGEINLPCLLLAGKDDKVVPISVMKEMANNLPNATLFELENVGHLSPLEVPEEFNTILLSFLDGKNLI
ncbi:MAG: alpha/beta hydrolase [Brevinematia bacterium]